MAEEKAVKQLLEKTRRLPSNKACVNCGKEAPFGHGDVCVKFLTFICHTCKSAHQSFSHRCKSVTLSNWTMDEVLQLTDQRGGGNLCARATWLGALDHLMLKPDDTLERTKEFINQAYNYKRYWRDADLSHIQQQGASSASPDPPARQPRARAPAPAPSSSFSSPLPAPPAKAPAPSFVDFEADFAADFGAAPTTTPSTASSSAAHDFGAFTAAPPASHDDGFGTSGFDFMQAPPPPPPPAPAPAPFDPFSAAPPLQPSRGPTANGSSGFDFMQPSAPSSFDPFGPSSSSAPPPSASKPAPPNSSSFAAFDMGGPPARPSGGSMMQGFGPAPGGGPAGPPRAMNAPPISDPFAALNAQPARGPFMGGPPPPRGMGMMGPGPGFGPARGGPMMMGQPPRMGPPGGMMGGPGGMMGGGGGPMGGGMMMGGPPRGGPMGGGNRSASPPRPLFPSFLQQNDSQKEPDPFEGLMWGLGK